MINYYLKNSFTQFHKKCFFFYVHILKKRMWIVSYLINNALSFVGKLCERSRITENQLGNRKPVQYFKKPNALSFEEVHDSCTMCTYMKISQLPKEKQEKKEVWEMCMNGVSKPSKEKVRIFIRNTNFTEEQTWNIINTLKKKYINKLIF